MSVSREQLEDALARINEVRAMLTELADDLEAEIKGRAAGELPRRIARDLEVVQRARALIAKLDRPPDLADH